MRARIALALALALGGCGIGGTSDRGPLGHPDSSGRICTPSDKQGQATDGFQALRPKAPVTLTGVRLIKPHGLVLRGAYVEPIKNHTLIGTRPGLFPVTTAAVGLRVADDRNLVLHLALASTTAEGVAEGVEVRYRSGGRSYRWVSHFGVAVAPVGTVCSG